MIIRLEDMRQIEHQRFRVQEEELDKGGHRDEANGSGEREIVVDAVLPLRVVRHDEVGDPKSLRQRTPNHGHVQAQDSLEGMMNSGGDSGGQIMQCDHHAQLSEGQTKQHQFHDLWLPLVADQDRHGGARQRRIGHQEGGQQEAENLVQLVDESKRDQLLALVAHQPQYHQVRPRARATKLAMHRPNAIEDDQTGQQHEATEDGAEVHDEDDIGHEDDIAHVETYQRYQPDQVELEVANQVGHHLQVTEHDEHDDRHHQAGLEIQIFHKHFPNLAIRVQQEGLLLVEQNVEHNLKTLVVDDLAIKHVAADGHRHPGHVQLEVDDRREVVEQQKVARHQLMEAGGAGTRPQGAEVGGLDGEQQTQTSVLADGGGVMVEVQLAQNLVELLQILEPLDGPENARNVPPQPHLGSFPRR